MATPRYHMESFSPAFDVQGSVSNETSIRFSKAQVDRLGDRPKTGEIAPDDLRSLDEYRRSFTSPYEHVVSTMRTELNLDPTG